MLGSNVPSVGGLPKAFQWADKWNCECIQIYVTLSRRWAVPELSEEEVQQFKSAWTQSSVKQVVAHVPYLLNLASSNKSLWEKSINRLSTELLRAQRLNVAFLVLHPGSYTSSKDGYPVN